MIDSHALLSTVSNIAKKEVGVLEVGTSNTGIKVNQYLASVGFEPGSPWCAAFVYFCLKQAADEFHIPVPMIRTASTGTMKLWASQHKILCESPEPGDIFLVGHKNVSNIFIPTHTGFVTDVHGQSFSTIEGNTNIDGSPDGIGVFARVRKLSDQYLFIRYIELIGKDSSPYVLLINNQQITHLIVDNNTILCPVRVWTEALKIDLKWDNEHQIVVFNNKPINKTVNLIDHSAYLPVKDLAHLANLTLSVDSANHTVGITIPAGYTYPV